MESPNTSGVIAGDTIKYSVQFNEKIRSITANGTASITLNGQSLASSSTPELITENGKSRVVYSFTLPDKNESGTIQLSSVSGLSVQDEAGKNCTYDNSSPSAPTQQYYKTMNVSCSPAHLNFSGGSTAKFNTNYTAILSAARGYNLPNSITVKVGGSTLSQGSDYTYNSGTGAITITGSKITDDIVITAAGVPKQSEVTFFKEKGTGGPNNTTATFDAALPTIDTPTRTGYTFQGYFTQSGGTGTQYYDAAGKSAKVCDFDSAISLYAHWTANHYSIKFDQNRPSKASASVQGNMSNESRIYDEGAKALTKNNYTLTGWTFQGWATTAGDGQVVTYQDTVSVENLTPDPNGTYTLYAVWTQNTYTITLEPMGGTNAGTESAIYDDTLPDITVPEKYGYNFLGYFDRETDGKKYYEANGSKALATYTVVGGITLYAHWAPITYIIRLYNDGNFVRDIPDVVYGTLKLPTAEECGLSRKNFDFVGWNIYAEQDWKMYSPGVVYATGLTGTQGDIVVLNASWQERPIHSLFYDANGGYSAPAAERLHEGESTTIGTAPAREDYTFAGWSLAANSTEVRYTEGSSFKMGSSDVTLYAIWKHNPSLTYNANGGSFNYSIAVTYPAAGSEVTLTDAVPVKVGYSFAGWTVDKDAESPVVIGAGGTFIMPETDTVLYAVYEVGTYSVTQQAAVGYEIHMEETGPYTYQMEAHFTVTGTSPKVYINGVLTSPGPDGKYSFTVTCDTTILVADGSKHSLVYSANGGEKAPTDMTAYDTNASTSVSPEEPTREGYSFQGWAEEDKATEPKYQAGETVQFEEDDVVLYAVWKANTYTVSYHADDEDVTGEMASETLSYGTPKALATHGFEKTGFNFVGWATEKGGEVVFEDEAEVVNLTAKQGATIELYAVWEEMKTMLYLDADGGGNGSRNFSALYGKALPTSGLNAPTKDGYIFGGYFAQQEGQGTQYFNESMQPVGALAEKWTLTDKELTIYAYWIPTTETLEKSVDQVQANLFSAAADLQAALENGDADLQTQIDNLKAAYAAADETLQQALKGQIDGVNSSLQGKIDGLQTTLNTTEDVLRKLIQALDERLSNDIQNLRDAIGRDEANISDLQKKLTQLEADYLAADTLVRGEFAAADAVLQGNITALETKLTAVDDALRQSINDLEAKLNKAVEDLETSIATNREQLDDALAKLKEAYEAADLAINNQITALQDKDSELTQSITDLTSKLTETDGRLQNAIQQVQTNLDNAKADLLKAIQDNEDDIEAKVAALDAAYQDADTTLRAEMTSADSALGKRIDDAINDLTTSLNEAKNDLTEAINGVQTNLDDAVSKLEQSIATNRGQLDQALEAMQKAYEAADTLLRSEMTSADNALGERIDKAVKDLTSTMNTADERLQNAIDDVQTNLNNARDALQAAIDANEKDIEDKVAAMDAAYKDADRLLTEKMENADSALGKRLDDATADLTSAMNKADEALQEAIDTVQQNLDAAKAELQATIDANEKDIETKVSAMNATLRAADALLRSDMTAADEALGTRIDALEKAMSDADKALQAAIDAVQTNLNNARTELQAAIDANEKDIEDKVAAMDEAYKQADKVLRTDMNTADEALGARIDALEKTMGDADSTLQNAIDAVQQNLDAARKELQTAIDTNEKDIEDKVKALDDAYKAADVLINSDIAGLKAKDSALAESISALDVAYKAADEALWEGIRQVEAKHETLKEESEKMQTVYIIVSSVLGGIAVALGVTLIVKTVRKKKSQP